MRLHRFLGTLLVALLAPLLAAPTASAAAAASSGKVVYVIPIREDIMPPLTYLVRRGVKEAMAARADLLVLDMETNGGRVDVTEEIIQIVGQFKGRTVTFVNRKAFSAGAFISVGTQQIYMSPQSVIGAAAPIMMSPGGTGTQALPDTMEAKMTSAILALIRTSAEKNGHNVAVIESMVDKSRELVMDGKVLNAKGQILTLTNLEAEKEYGEPKKKLLSSGTVENLDALIKQLGFVNADVHRVEPLGAEKLAFWLNAIGPLLLIVGAAGIYIEMKTPGFGLPGIVGISAFALYFMGGYVAGLAGLEWMVVFLFGITLVILELFVFPGTILLGVGGGLLMLVGLVMGTTDIYPGMPNFPTVTQLKAPMNDLMIAFAGSVALVFALSRYLPKTTMYGALVSHSASGVASVAAIEEQHRLEVGAIGVTLSTLRPGGKAQFGDVIRDVMSQGEMIEKGRRVKIIRHSASEAVVEPVDV